MFESPKKISSCVYSKHNNLNSNKVFFFCISLWQLKYHFQTTFLTQKNIYKVFVFVMSWREESCFSFFALPLCRVCSMLHVFFSVWQALNETSKVVELFFFRERLICSDWINTFLTVLYLLIIRSLSEIAHTEKKLHFYAIFRECRSKLNFLEHRAVIKTLFENNQCSFFMRIKQQ